jgi:hypothetical protein
MLRNMRAAPAPICRQRPGTAKLVQVASGPQVSPPITSKDGTTAFISVLLDISSSELSEDEAQKVADAAGHLDDPQVGPLVVDGLRQRAPCAARSVGIEHDNPTARIDPEVEDVANVFVLERVFRAADLLPHDHVFVLEQPGRAFTRKLRGIFLRRGSRRP